MPIKYPLAVALCLLICCSACQQVSIAKEASDYERFCESIPDSTVLTEDKHIALMLYNPQGCMPCNYILTNILTDSVYLGLVGNNSFIVFPSVRPSELQDYDRLLTTYGNVHLKYINDKKLFDLLRLQDTAKLGGRPKWLGLNKKTKECVCFGLKEMYLLDSINAYFK